MKHVDCTLKYIGQTGGGFKVRYKEYIHAIRSNKSNSDYLIHILNTGHTYGPITDTMVVIRTGRKGRHLNTLERYYIYKTNRDNLHMNDIHNETYNPIFQIVHMLYDSSSHTIYKI
jgi:hypothetical protein